MRDHNFPQVSRTLRSIPANLNPAVVCRVSILHLISSSFSLFSKLFGTVTSAPITVSITIHPLFFFCSLTWYMYLFIFSLCLIFTLWSIVIAKSTCGQILFLSLSLSLSLINTRFIPLAGIRSSVCVSKSPRTLWQSFSRTDSVY